MRERLLTIDCLFSGYVILSPTLGFWVWGGGRGYHGSGLRPTPFAELSHPTSGVFHPSNNLKQSQTISNNLKQYKLYKT